MASANWLPLGHVFYEKVDRYDLDWGATIDLSKYVVAAAPFGGPLALMKDDRDNPNVNVKPIISVYTSAGKMVSQMRWNSGRLKKMGWSYTEDLLCVQDDGVVLVYDIFLNFKRQFSLGQEAKDVKVLDVRFFNSYKGTGIAVLTCSYRIYIVNSVEDVRVRRLAEISELSSAPTSWDIITMDTSKGQPQALVANQNKLYMADLEGNIQQMDLEISTEVEAFVDMAVSFNNKYIALFTNKGVLWIGSADLKKRYCEFNTNSGQRPTQLVWSGPGAVVALWDKLMLVVGPDKDYISFKYDSAVRLVEELDGLRIIGRDNVEFFRKVPVNTEQIFKIGSMEPGAWLFEASREFERKSQKADEYIRSIKDQLETAVSQCILAAGHELEPRQQKQLLKAATFGKCFLTNYNPEPFVNMCQMLRVLNQVNQYTIGIPLTYNQLEHLTIPVLIDRLVLRKFFYLAIRICQYLKLPENEGASRTLAHWACYKVKQKNQEDEVLAQVIAQKLGDTPGVSYSEIASMALECGRKALAIRLLDHEPKAARQIPLFLQMKKEQLALQKAIESGDTDLIYFVLLRIKEKDGMSQGEFFMIIRNIPVAYNLYLQYCRQQYPKQMEQLYYQEDNFQEEAICKVEDSLKQERLDDRLQVLKEAKESFNKARNEFAAKQIEDEIKLLSYQRRLEEDLNQSYVDLSLHETIYQLILKNNNKMAEQLKKEFRVPEKRYWWLRVNALAEANEWLELEKFSKTKKPQLGIEAFVDVCMKHNNRHEALKYIPRVSADKKVMCYIRIGQFRMAAEAAKENRNDNELTTVLKMCPISDQQTIELVQSYKQQLADRR